MSIVPTRPVMLLSLPSEPIYITYITLLMQWQHRYTEVTGGSVERGRREMVETNFCCALHRWPPLGGRWRHTAQRDGTEIPATFSITSIAVLE
jgi:hypothetical protein